MCIIGVCVHVHVHACGQVGGFHIYFFLWRCMCRAKNSLCGNLLLRESLLCMESHFARFCILRFEFLKICSC